MKLARCELDNQQFWAVVNVEKAIVKKITGVFALWGPSLTQSINEGVSADGEAKYWLEPKIELAENNYYSEQQLNEVRLLIEHHRDELIDAWLQRFYSGS